MQFGYVKRPTHRSRAYDKDRFEVCNHRYSALADSAHGAAVLNDSKYGISMNGSSLELTLLRAAASPQMRADNGHHHFAYAFTAWEGAFIDSDVIRDGYEFNVEPLCVEGKRESLSFVQIDSKNIFLDTVKPAEDGSGDLILRFYEAAGAATKCKVSLNISGSAVICNMLEEAADDKLLTASDMELEFRAFEVKTLRIKR
jgi:alpha-mannosidase